MLALRSARVYIHPRCLVGPAVGALAATLEAHGIDSYKWLIGPPSPKGYCEFVQLAEERGPITVYRRMDGSTFEHREGEPAPPLEAA